MTKRNLRSNKKTGRQNQRIRFALALPKRSETVSSQLLILDDVLGHFFADENFVTLLEAESLTAVPSRYQALFEDVSRGNEIRK
jgi:hypothetical protein